VVTQADLVGKNSINAILDSTRLAIEQAGLLSAGLMAWAAPLGAERGENVAGDDIAVWLCGLDAAPKFTNKRRRCAQQLDKHIAHNSNALTQNRALLMTLNELLPLADRSPERELVLTEKIQHLRTDQKRLLELVRQFGELKDEMLETITQIVGEQVLDEEVRRGRELVATCERNWLKSPVNDGDIYSSLVVDVRSDIKKLHIEVFDSGQQIVVLSVPFSKVRADWNLDPMGFVKGSMLEAKVMAQDQQHVTFAFTHQIQTN
jgi:hypothetical protein